MAGHGLPTHDLSLQVRIGIFFSGIVMVLLYWFMRCKIFEPYIKIMVEPGFVIVDKTDDVICMAFTS